MSDPRSPERPPGPWSTHLRARLAGLRLDAAREADIVEELSQHLDERYEELRREGASDDEARRVAIEELREPGALASSLRPLRQAHPPEPIPAGAPRRSLFLDLWADLRYAARMLRKERGFAAAAVLTLALGIGANSAIFALVDATLLRPLAFPDAGRLVVLWDRTAQSPRERVSPNNLVDWRERSRSFEVIAGLVPNVGGMVLSGADGTVDTIPRQWVTAEFFDVLGIRAIVGRTFRPSDDRGRVSAVVISDALWRTRFNADPGVVGREIRLDGDLWTVLGVVRHDAQLFRTEMWALRPITGAPPAARKQFAFQAIGRLKPGVTLDAARADMRAVAERLAREYPDANAGRTVTLEEMREVVIGSDLRQTSLLFLGVVGFVLLICCANVANLLLARATVRKRELAMRSALGADRLRVMRQLLTESLLLSVIGGALGIVAGAAILRAAPSVIPQELLPPAVTLAFDLRVVGFCAASALFVGLLFGLVPAWQATRLASAHVISSEGRTATGRGDRVRGMLVAGQVATAVLLLFGAGLLLRTLLAIEAVDRGYRAESVLTMLVDPPGPQRVPWLPFYETVDREVMTLAGVRGVAWATTLPFGRSYMGPSFFEIVGDPPPREVQRPTADYQIVSPTYFTTLDLPIAAGRGFDSRDRPDGVPVCAVNEAFVRRYVQGRSPIGLRLSIRPTDAADAKPVVREIVGVVRQVKAAPNETEELIQIYVPLAQDTPGDIFLLVRPESGTADALAPAVRAALARVDKTQLVSVRSVMTLDDVASAATSRHRFRAILVMAFAGLALLLAAIGVFGILAYSVQQRVRDFGVRRALGATTRDVMWLVGAGAGRVIAAGALVGLALATLLAQPLDTMLFGVEPLDAPTFSLVALVMALTAVVSAIGPAWRAARVDPAVALRTE